MTEKEFVQWCAYYKLEPWGDDWFQTGSLMALYANRHAKKGSKFYPQDFIPFQDSTDHRKQRLKELKDEYDRRRK